jgi:hypothetical protein
MLSRQYVQAEMKDGWRSLSDAEKADVIGRAVKEAREDARDLMRQRLPNIVAADE